MRNWKMSAMINILLCLGLVVHVTGQCFTDCKQCGIVKTGPEALANGSLYFALSLFKSVTEPSSLPSSGNCQISSVSVRIALMLSYLGARGNTKTEMQTVLRVGNEQQDQLLKAYHELRTATVHNATEDANYTLTISDRIYFDNSLTLQKCVLGQLSPDAQKTALKSAPEPSRKLINTWVEDHTNGKIVDLIPPGAINSATFMIVVNAIYFKGYWAIPFSPSRTSDQDFFVGPQRPKKVSMMYQKPNFFPYASSSKLDCTALELPYSGHEMSMVIVLPNSNSNAKDLIAKLSPDNLNELFGQLQPTAVQLSLPKFNLTQPFELTKNLNSLGMRDFFDAAKADLSGFTGTKNIFTTFVHHKTFIAVDEHGTEAAAATAVLFEFFSIIEPDKNFEVNRPFLFFIRNIKYNAIFFMGLISDPTVQN